MLSLCLKQQTSWDKMWAALEEIDDCDFLTQEERHQDAPTREGIFDFMIVAHALAEGCILVTSDKAFDMVPNLVIL